MSSTTFAIQTEHLTKRFASGQGVFDLSLSVPEQSIFGFLGPNGAGKTTTIRLLLSLIEPDRGAVRLFSEPISRRSRAGLRHVGALVEAPSLYGHLSGTDNLDVTRRLLALPPERIPEVLALVELSGDAHRPVRDYSLGMRQRLALALALLSKPRLLILDEPANGLDPAGIQDLRALLRRLVREGLTVFLSSHLLAELELIATHVAVLQTGRLLFEGELEALRRRNRPRLKIRCTEPGRAAELLARAGEPPHEVCGDTLRLEPRTSSASALNRLLVEAGIGVDELTCEEPSLEALFFHLTRPAGEAAHV